MIANLTSILLIAIVWGIIVGSIMYGYFKLYGWSAITMAIIITYLIVNFTYPIGNLMNERDSYSIALYLLFEILIPMYLFIVLIVMLLRFARDNECVVISEELGSALR